MSCCLCFNRYGRWRKAVLVVLIALKVAAFVLLAVHSVQDKSENMFLICATVQSFCTLGLLGFFANSWTETWPDEGAKSTVEVPSGGRWHLLLYTAGSQLAIVMTTLLAGDSKETFDPIYFPIIAAEYCSQLLSMLAAIDMLSAKRNQNFVLDVAWTDKSPE